MPTVTQLNLNSNSLATFLDWFSKTNELVTETNNRLDFGGSQTLSSPQKAQALTNLGVSTFAQTILDDTTANTVAATIGVVKKSGDTMTGQLVISAGTASTIAVSTTLTTGISVYGTTQDGLANGRLGNNNSHGVYGGSSKSGGVGTYGSATGAGGYAVFGLATLGVGGYFSSTNTARGDIEVPRQIKVNGNTVWHAGNDGSGSGLDADLLDGQSSAYYTDIVSRLGYTPVDVNDNTNFLLKKASYRPTITNALANLPPNGEIILVGGRDAEGDMPPVFFKYDSSSSATDNGGTIRGTGTGRLIWVPQEKLNLKLFGIKPASYYTALSTTILDQTSVIQAALNVAATLGYIHIMIPATTGTDYYLVNGTLGFKSNTCFTTDTPGTYAKCIRKVLLTDGMFMVRGTSGAPIENVIIEDIWSEYQSPNEVSRTLTAGETGTPTRTFTFNNSASNVMDLLVVRNGVYQSLFGATGAGYTSTTVTLATSAPILAAGDIMIVSEGKASSRNAGFYSEGISAVLQNKNIKFRNLKVTGNWYVGVEMAWTTDGIMENIYSKGVYNRPIYTYLGNKRIRVSDIEVDGSGMPGSLISGIIYCDYAVQSNTSGLGDVQIDVSWYNLKLYDCLGRGWSHSGPGYNLYVDRLSVENVGFYGIFIGDFTNATSGQSQNIMIRNAIIGDGTTPILINAPCDIQAKVTRSDSASGTPAINVVVGAFLLSGETRETDFVFDFQVGDEIPGNAPTGSIMTINGYDRVRGTCVAVAGTGYQYDLRNINDINVDLEGIGGSHGAYMDNINGGFIKLKHRNATTHGFQLSASKNLTITSNVMGASNRGMQINGTCYKMTLDVMHEGLLGTEILTGAYDISIRGVTKGNTSGFSNSGTNVNSAGLLTTTTSP